MIPRGQSPEYKLMLRAFERGPMTTWDVAGELGLQRRSAYSHVLEAHKRGEIHIVTWGKRKIGPWFPVYAKGEAVDTLSPPEQALAAAREKRYRG